MVAKKKKKTFCREFDETMDALQRDLEATEKENADLREKTRNMTKKALLMASFRNFFDTSSLNFSK